MFRTLLAAVAVLLLASCGSAALIRNWRNDAYDGAGYEKLLVIGVSPVAENRRSFEVEFARQLDERTGVDGVPSSDLIPDIEQLDSLRVGEVVRTNGFDAVLVTRLVKIERDVTLQSGEKKVVPETYYNDLYGYYYTVHREVRTPSTVGETDVVVLETNLYDTAGGALVWTGTTESYSPSSIPELVDDLALLVLTNMHEHGLIGGAK